SLKEKLLRPWDRALRGRHLFLFRRHAVRLPLTLAERTAIQNVELGAALDRLSAVVQEGGRAREQRAAAFEGARARGRTAFTGRPWLASLSRLEGDALRQRQELEAGDEAWDQSWGQAVDRLHGWLTRIDTLLDSYDPLLADPVPEEVSVRLTRAE